LSFCGFVPRGYSDIIHPPNFNICFAKLIFSLGYISSSPLPKTAIALPSFVEKSPCLCKIPKCA